MASSASQLCRGTTAKHECARCRPDRAAGLLAVAVGAMMFYGRLKGVYVAILMLVVSLLLGLFMRQTADPCYAIGGAYLGGMNGLRPGDT